MSNTDLLSGDTAESLAKSANGAAPKRRAGLSGMVLAELRELAGQLGIPSTTGMRKGDLIAAIKERQGGGPGGAPQQLPLNGADAPAEAKPKRERVTRAAQPAEVRPEPQAAE